MERSYGTGSSNKSIVIEASLKMTLVAAFMFNIIDCKNFGYSMTSHGTNDEHVRLIYAQGIHQKITQDNNEDLTIVMIVENCTAAQRNIPVRHIH